MDRLLESKGEYWGESYRFSGQVLMTKGGKPVYSRSMGFGNREKKSPIGPDTIFSVGSVTKQFTATAILQLQEAGLLKVTDTIDKYLPNYPSETAAKITVHHLLTHTSGIPCYTRLPNYETEISARENSVEELLELFWNLPLEFEPGKQFNYSNSGYVVLGAIIEAVSNMSYGDYVEKNLFTKAGLKRTTYGAPKGQGDHALGYDVSPEETVVPAEPWSLSSSYAAGGVHSTANDLVLWDAALKNGTIINSESLEQLYRPFLNNYAYGWVREEEAVSHGGGQRGVICDYVRMIDRDIVIVAWTNIPVSMSITREIIDGLTNLLKGQPVPLSTETPVIPLSEEETAGILGGYVLSQKSREEAIQAGMPAFILNEIEAMRISSGGRFLEAERIDGLVSRLYRTAPGRYFVKREMVVLEFLFESGPNLATSMRANDGPVELLFEHNDAAASKLFESAKNGPVNAPQ